MAAVGYEAYLELAFQAFVFGGLALVFAHNFFVSIFYYMARQNTLSNLLKIVFNFAGCLRACLSLVMIAPPAYVTNENCQGIIYTFSFGQVIFLTSLAIFMSWRLRQIENKIYDLVVTGVLLLTRISLHLTQFALTKPARMELADLPGVNFCVQNIRKSTSRGLFYSYIGVDLMIDVYVTIRLMQILSRANRNAKHVTVNMRRPHKRSLFTAVIYWNFLRLFAAILHHSINIYSNATNLNNGYKYWSSSFVALVFLSYAITADAEIVRTIEGRPANSTKGSSYTTTSGSTDKTLKSYQSSLPSPRLPSYKSQTTSFKDEYGNAPRSPSTELASSKLQPVYEDVNGQRMGVSMKRASFFEWASNVVGFRRNDSDEHYNNIENDRDIEKAAADDTVEVVLDERPGLGQVAEESEGAGNSNLEPGLSNDQRRSSTFSGDTVTNGVQPSGDTNLVVHAL